MHRSAGYPQSRGTRPGPQTQLPGNPLAQDPRIINARYDPQTIFTFSVWYSGPNSPGTGGTLVGHYLVSRLNL